MVQIWNAFRYTHLIGEEPMGDRITVKEAAERLGKSIRLVTRFINDGRLKAERFGRSWAIAPADLDAFKALDRPSGAAGHKTRKPERKGRRKKT
jgi:excisionase family DNA binding protein